MPNSCYDSDDRRDFCYGMLADPFVALPVSTEDTVRVPAGYRADLLFAWGDPVSDGPRGRADASDSAADRRGEVVLGTLNNCAMGATPRGTCLTCEENFNGYFKGPQTPDADQKRHGLTEKGFGFRRHEFDERFDATLHPNEPNRFGWVVEIDPWRPDRPPVKRTALGRFKHEGATVTLARDGRAVVEMGDDERFEYVDKFVSRDRYVPGRETSTLLDEGTLHVARFGEDGSGRWLPLRHGEKYPNGALTAENGFAGQGDVAIRCRQAADLAGATKMDRPEWIAVHPDNGEVYVTLTNNGKRGTSETPGLNAANPRPENVFGHIVRWREQGGDAYGSPDGLRFDAAGHLWIQTDVSTSVLNKGDHARLGNHQMLVADPLSGETRRFMTGPNGCEVTGISATPDGRTLFVNIQHPGERSDPARPTAVSSWPANQFPAATGGRPRSATIVVSRDDGKAILPA